MYKKDKMNSYNKEKKLLNMCVINRDRGSIIFIWTFKLIAWVYLYFKRINNTFWFKFMIEPARFILILGSNTSNGVNNAYLKIIYINYV